MSIEGDIIRFYWSWCLIQQWHWNVVLLLCALGQILGDFPMPPPSIPTLATVEPSSE
jgi:hypothetical protein